jgi:ABC-2 type transport system ATP-binding protein
MISEYLVVLREGRVIFSGRTKELLAKQQPRIRVKSDHPGGIQIAREIAEKSGHLCEVFGDELLVTAPPEYGSELNRHSFSRGVTLTEISPIRPSLEETFFEMTGTEMIHEAGR